MASARAAVRGARGPSPRSARGIPDTSGRPYPLQYRRAPATQSISPPGPGTTGRSRNPAAAPAAWTSARAIERPRRDRRSRMVMLCGLVLASSRPSARPISSRPHSRPGGGPVERAAMGFDRRPRPSGARTGHPASMQRRHRGTAAAPSRSPNTADGMGRHGPAQDYVARCTHRRSPRSAPGRSFNWAAISRTAASGSAATSSSKFPAMSRTANPCTSDHAARRGAASAASSSMPA